MFKKLFFAFLTLLISICMVHSTFAAVTTKESLKVLYITESYGANTTGSVEWRMSENILAKKLPPQYSLGTNGINQTTFSSASQALNTVENQVSLLINSFVQNIASYLKNNKITYAKVDWFYSFYDQGDNNTLKKVYLPLIIYPDGKIRNLGARVITTQPKILYYIYKTRATEDIPQSWGYSDGGKLYKYVLDQNFNQISYTVVDTGGKYDPPITPEGDSTIDPDSGLKLLINEVVTKEIGQYSALFAIVDYARQIRPYYECDDQGNCNAVVSVESFTRVLSIADACTGPNDPLGGNQYQNTGRIGYTLQYTNERYFVEPDGNYTLTAQSIGYTTVGQDFNKTVQVTQTSSSELQKYIIDPFKTNQIYDFTNDTVNNLSCDRYIYAGAKCAQAPISTYLPTPPTWMFRVPYSSYCGEQGPVLVANSDLGNNVIRWRFIYNDGRCIRFDTYKYNNYQCLSCQTIPWGCDIRWICSPPWSDNCYQTYCCCTSWWGDCNEQCYSCAVISYDDYSGSQCCNYATCSSPTMFIWEECGGDLHDRCYPYCGDTDTLYIVFNGIAQSCLRGSNKGCKWWGFYSAPIKIPINQRNAANCGQITAGYIHGPWYVPRTVYAGQYGECGWFGENYSIRGTSYWNFYKNF